MKLKLFIDTFERKLVKSATSALPVELGNIFREDYIDLEIQLLEPTASLTDPYTIIDITSLSLQVAIGTPGSDPEALQSTWTKNTTTNIFSGSLNINTTEMVAAFTAATTDSINRFLEVEVEGTSSQYHTVLQKGVTLSKDIIVHPLVAPVDVTTGTAFANSFSTTATNSNTVEWSTSGDNNLAHVKGMSATTLVAGKYIKVKSDASGFELGTVSTSGSAIDDLSDVDTTTAAPSSGDHLKWNGSNWVPESHTIDKLSDVDTTTAAPTSGQILSWNGSNWVPASGASAGSQNLWATVTGDSGTTTANSTTDSLKIQGGAGIDTSITGDVVTVAGEDASETNKGIASFAAADFTVTSGNVVLDAIAIAKGGHGATTAADGFDNLAPTTTAGDIITHDGSDNVRLAKGAANLPLKMNSGGTALEYGTLPVAGGGTGATTQQTAIDALTAVSGATNEHVLTKDTSTGNATWKAASGGGSSYSAGDGLDLTSTTFSLDLKSAGGLAIDSTEAKVDVNNLTDLTNSTFGTANFGAGDHIACADASDSNATKRVKFPVELGMAISDESTDLTTGTAKLTFRMPHAMTLTEVRANVNTAPVGSTLVVDINEGGSTILSTKLSIDASEKTSTSAAAAAVISDTALADDGEITIDIDQIGSSTSGRGLKCWLIGYR